MRGGLHKHARVFATEGARAVMAFKTHREDNRAPQQLRVHGSMRDMTTLAALFPDARMFKNKWSAFINVTLETRLLVIESARHEF
jgi:hypothetical protein